MFGLGFQEILIILIIFLFLFGAKRLPQIGEGLGKTVRELRKMREEKKTEKDRGKGEKKENVVTDLKKEIEAVPGVKEAKEIKEAVNQVKNITKLLK